VATPRKPTLPTTDAIDAFCARFDDLFNRRAARQAFRHYLIGLLLPREHHETMTVLASLVPGSVRTLSAEQVQRLFDTTHGDRFDNLWVLLATTGLRLGEALGLKWADVDLAGRRLMVRRTLVRRRHGGGLVFDDVKSEYSRRTVRLSIFASDALQAQRDRQEFDRKAAETDGLTWTDHDLVFCSTIGTPLEQGRIHRHFKPALTRAGLPAIRIHDLRHTAATLMLLRGVHPKIVSEMLGHSNITITPQLYIHDLLEGGLLLGLQLVRRTQAQPSNAELSPLLASSLLGWRARWAPGMQRRREERAAPRVPLLTDFPKQLGDIRTALLPSILQIADVGLEGGRGQTTGSGMHDAIARRDRGIDRAADRDPTDTHLPRNVPEALSFLMPPLDLFPPSDPSGTTVRQTLLLRAERFCWTCRWWRVGDGHGDLPPASLEHLVQGAARILDEMKAISHLDGLRGSDSRSLGVRLSPVAHHHLDARMLGQPCGEGLGLSSREEINRRACLQIDQDGGIGVTAAQRQIIDAEHAGRLHLAVLVPLEQAKQGVRGDRQPSSMSQPGACFASHHPGQLDEERVRSGRALRTLGQGRSEAFSKGRSWTGGVRAAKAADPEDEPNRTAAPGQISRMAIIVIVNPLGHDATGGAAGAGCGPFCFQDDGGVVEYDAANGKR
jgi:integrase